MNITSDSFENGTMLPTEYTCDGEGINPQLSISGAPKEAKSFVLIVDDPDAPIGIFTHWIVWNISSETTVIPESAKIGIEGVGTSGTIGYVSPCPPAGKPHRYRFNLYALDSLLTLNKGATRSQLENAMRNHVLAKAVLEGNYKR